MFGAIEIPFGAVMLYNVVKLKPGVSFDDVEMTVGEMCNVVKNTYGNEEGGFIGGQVFRFGGFVSSEGTLGATAPEGNSAGDEHIAIVTYWNSYEQHEKSHADSVFREKFGALAELCTDTYEIGYEMLWQGMPETS